MLKLKISDLVTQFATMTDQPRGTKRKLYSSDYMRVIGAPAPYGDIEQIARAMFTYLYNLYLVDGDMASTLQRAFISLSGHPQDPSQYRGLLSQMVGHEFRPYFERIETRADKRQAICALLIMNLHVDWVQQVFKFIAPDATINVIDMDDDYRYKQRSIEMGVILFIMYTWGFLDIEHVENMKFPTLRGFSLKL